MASFKGTVGAAAAAPAAVASAIQGAAEEMMNTLKEAFGKVKAVITETVAAFSPVQVLQFQRAMLDLQATVGQMMAPALRAATEVVRELADYVYSLPSGFKQIITVLAKVLLAGGAFATVVGTIGSALAAIAPLFSLAGVVAASLAGLVYAFSRTEGGAKFFSDALKHIEQVLAGVWGTANAVWQAIEPARQAMSKAFDDLGKELSKLLDAIKPIIGAGLVVAGAILKLVLEQIVKAITWTVKKLGEAVSWLTKQANDLTSWMGATNEKLPNTDRDKRSAYGLGWGGGQVGDAIGQYLKIQQDIFKNARAADPKEKRENEMLNHIKIIKEKVVEMAEKIKTRVADTVQRVEKTADDASWLIFPGWKMYKAMFGRG